MGSWASEVYGKNVCLALMKRRLSHSSEVLTPCATKAPFEVSPLGTRCFESFHLPKELHLLNNNLFL